MRRAILLLAAAALTAGLAVPVIAHPSSLDGPDPAIWLSDPDGVDGVSGIEQGDPIEGAWGYTRIRHRSATIRVGATGLEPGHTYTMWVVYFNDSTLCVDGCNGPDLSVAGAGVIFGDGKVGRPDGTAVFTARLRNGAGAEYVGETPPPPFAFAPFKAGENNEFHIVIKSHGPKIPGLVRQQLNSFGGGCEVSVGPLPEQVGDFPVPQAPGECGEIQLYVFK